jgi:hypothetical protein
MSGTRFFIPALLQELFSTAIHHSFLQYSHLPLPLVEYEGSFFRYHFLEYSVPPLCTPIMVPSLTAGYSISTVNLTT